VPNRRNFCERCTGEAKVQEELYTLARNNAAGLGATNLVQHGRPKDGEQSFTAYRCADLG
jgi:hypothetical protein